jgi:hypothetical protein
MRAQPRENVVTDKQQRPVRRLAAGERVALKVGVSTNGATAESKKFGDLYER